MKKVILDTDLGCDSDDIGAVVVLNQLYKKELVLPLLITSVNSNIEPAIVIDEINRYYNSKIPIGMNLTVPYGIKDGYAKDIVSKFNISTTKEFMDSSLAIHNTLLESDEITLIAVGPLTNIANYINKYGESLLNEKVKEMYVMAGNFVSSNAEWNITEDINAMKIVLKKYHNKMVFIPFEVGYDVYTARNLINSDTLMGYGYFIHNGGPRPSWDPITVYYAITQSNDFTLSSKGTVNCDEKGVTTFIKGEGNHYYMLNNFNKSKVEDLLEKIMIP